MEGSFQIHHSEKYTTFRRLEHEVNLKKQANVLHTVQTL